MWNIEPNDQEFPDHTIIIKNDTFLPQYLEVKSGDKVVWFNEDKNTHSVKFSNDEFPEDFIEPDDTLEIIFENYGQYDYFCSEHPDELGQINVRDVEKLDKLG